MKKDEVVSPREIISINEGWSFYKYDREQTPDNLIYDIRPEIGGNNEYLVADAKPTEAVKSDYQSQNPILKPWILPTANNFMEDKSNQYVRPVGNPGIDFPFVQSDFDDTN